MDGAFVRVVASLAIDHRRTVHRTCDVISAALKAADIDAMLVPFGSTVSGFAVEIGCDIDLVLSCRPHVNDMRLPPERRMRATVKRARDAIIATAGAKKMVAILSARVPILKFLLPLEREVPVDLCFNNLNGCRNSELLRQLAAYIGGEAVEARPVLELLRALLGGQSIYVLWRS